MRSYIARRFQTATAGLVLDTAALARFDDVIDLSIGDTDYTTDPRIIDRAFRDAHAGYTRYGDPKGDPELIDAVCVAWQADWGQALDPAHVMVSASSCMGMSLVLMAITDPDDEIIVLSPYFSPYKQQIELAGGRCVDVVTHSGDNYRISAEALEAAVTPRTKAIIFNNPNNPTGMGYDEAAMQVLADIAERNDLLVIADEIYTTYLFEGTFVPFRTLPRMAARTITLNSFSKNFLMTGWRVGVIIAGPELLDVAGRINAGLIYTAPSISQRAAIEALNLREEIKATYIAEYRARVYAAADRIEGIAYFDLVRPKGTFYLFPGITRTGLDATAFCAYALEHAHVLLSPGDVFGVGGRGCVRLACTVPLETQHEAFDRLERLRF